MQRPRPHPTLDHERQPVLGHDAHFLERAAVRPRGEEMDRAMRLYHHPGVVRQVLRRLLPPRRPTDRIAIALAPTPPSPHVIVTWGGAFVTFLSADMKLRGMTALPYAAFARDLEAEEGRYEEVIVRRRQLQQLPQAVLLGALLDGPGHVHREMVQVVALAPATYELAVLIALGNTEKHLYRLHKLLDQAYDLVLRSRSDPRAVRAWQGVWRQVLQADASAQLCFHLLGLIDTPTMTRLLAEALERPTTLSPEIAFALARHRGGGPALLAAFRSAAQPAWLRPALLGALMGHAVLHPRGAPALAASLRAEPVPHLKQDPNFFLLWPELAGALPEEAEEMLDAVAAEMGPPGDGDPVSFPVPRDRLLKMLHGRRPVWQLFPPRAEAGRLREQWERHMAEPHQPKVPEVRQRVRTGPQVGRNDPCPCGSGRKYKRCCLGRAPAASPERPPTP